VARTGLATVAGVTLLPRLSWARFRYVPYFSPIEDMQTLNYLLLLERLKAAFYHANADKPYLVGGLGVSTLKSLVDEIRDREDAHVALLEGLLGANAQAAPTFQGLDADTQAEFLITAQTIEDVIVSAYLGTVPLINDKQVLDAAAALMATEARHAGALRAYRKQASTSVGGDSNTSLTEDGGPLQQARTKDQVLALAAQFIATKAA
jgi:hypothetical protein